MDPKILAALRAIATAADVKTALDAFITELGALDPPDTAAQAVEGDSPAMTMRKALARMVAAKPSADTLGPKVLARLGEKTEGAALMRVSALLLAEQANGGLLAAADMTERKKLATDTMKRAGLARHAFFLDGSEELHEDWKGGTLEDMKRALDRIAGAGVSLTRQRVAPAGGDDAGLAERAKKSGMTVEQRRTSEANVGGAAGRET